MTVELKLDETLARFEVQDWIDNVFSVQFPDIEAKIKTGCQGCNDSLKEIAKWKKGQEKLYQQMTNILEEAEKFEKENELLKAQIETKRKKLFDILTEYEIGSYDVNIHQFYEDVYDIHSELMELAE